MSTTNDGGPAFPCPTEMLDADTRRTGFISSDPGMTLRDYFAAQALTAIIAKHGVLSCNRDVSREEESEPYVIYHAKGVDQTPDMCHIGTAVIAYEIADAMLAARKAVLQ